VPGNSSYLKIHPHILLSHDVQKPDTALAKQGLTPTRSPFLGNVPPKGSGRRELAQLVAHHVLRDVDGNVTAAIVYGDGMPYHLRKDRRGPRPGLDDPFLAPTIHCFNPFQQFDLNVRSFF
jgi:hypothetical protein